MRIVARHCTIKINNVDGSNVGKCNDKHIKNKCYAESLIRVTMVELFFNTLGMTKEVFCPSR